jgi:hypothetical protein
VRAYEVVGSQPPNAIGQISFGPSQCFNPHMISIPVNGTGHLVCEGDHSGPGTFVVLDLQAMTATSSGQLGVFPDGMALLPPAVAR